MDFAQEQQNEVEILKSIYFEEFIDLAEGDAAARHYALELSPDEDAYAGFFPGEEDYIRKHWKLYLTVSAPEDYPQSPPELTLSRTRPTPAAGSDDDGSDDDDEDDSDDEYYGSDEDSDDDDEENPLHIAPVLAQLDAVVADQAAMLAGEILVFSVVSALKEEMAALAKDRVAAARAADAERIRLEEEAEAKKFHGTQVTVERFLAWKKVFDADMAAKAAADRAREEKAAGLSARKIQQNAAAAAAAMGGKTGRELFEADKSLASSDTKFMGDDEESVDTAAFEAADESAEAGVAALSLDADEDDDSGVAAMLLKDRTD
ncbi:hypothetical protein H9P43_009182 [Blastocladiella emersonii ATCC 22665]|nr:hypothetical protein H9P43_009182 [Blastocladiella emersonii ATCC 22665]